LILVQNSNSLRTYPGLTNNLANLKYYVADFQALEFASRPSSGFFEYQKQQKTHELAAVWCQVLGRPEHGPTDKHMCLFEKSESRKKSKHRCQETNILKIYKYANF
jgi:hypothetical protein